jgi:hypothetical protein
MFVAHFEFAVRQHVYLYVLILLYMCRHTAICVSSYCYICVLILLYVCPHTAIYVSSYCYICVVILLYACPHTAIYVSSYCYMCVLILLYMCPHTAMCVSSYCYICVLILLYVCPHTAICVLILLYVSSYCYMCPRTAVYVYSYSHCYIHDLILRLWSCHPSAHAYIRVLVLALPYVSAYNICVLISLCMRTSWATKTVCPHTAIDVSSYCYICVLILLYMCPHLSIYASRYAKCLRQHTSAYVSIRQHTSAYVSIRQHTRTNLCVALRQMPQIYECLCRCTRSHRLVKEAGRASQQQRGLVSSIEV